MREASTPMRMNRAEGPIRMLILEEYLLRGYWPDKVLNRILLHRCRVAANDMTLPMWYVTRILKRLFGPKWIKRKYQSCTPREWYTVLPGQRDFLNHLTENELELQLPRQVRLELRAYRARGFRPANDHATRSQQHASQLDMSGRASGTRS